MPVGGTSPPWGTTTCLFQVSLAGGVGQGGIRRLLCRGRGGAVLTLYPGRRFHAPARLCAAELPLGQWPAGPHPVPAAVPREDAFLAGS